jgi:SAM-dependent methyltransferase
MSLLDIGCGPGSITAGLAARVAPGRTVGADVDPATLPSAAELEAIGAPYLEFQQANAYALPFEDAAFDAVFMHFVLQHLNEPGLALREACRVLRPGGVIGLADADFGAHLISPASPPLLRAIDLQEAYRNHANGDPRVGRELGTLLAAAAFTEIRVTATAVTQGEPRATAATATFQAGYLVAPDYARRVIELGLATDEELARMRQAWLEWGAVPGAFWTRVTIEAVGRKP